MKSIKPFCRSTIVIEHKHEWKPKNIADFFVELDHIESSCKGKPFYLGQKDINWLLDWPCCTKTFKSNLK